MNKKKQTKIQEILTSELTNWIIISCSSAFVEYFYVETNYQTLQKYCLKDSEGSEFTWSKYTFT